MCLKSTPLKKFENKFHIVLHEVDVKNLLKLAILEITKIFVHKKY